MELKQFTEKVVQGVQEYLGEEVLVSGKIVRKNNGVCLSGLMISEKNSNLWPTIYMEPFYQEYESGKGIAQVVRDVGEIYEKSKVSGNFKLDFFLDYEKARKRIFCKLINYEKNKELLSQVPHREFLDLAVVCYYSYMNDMIGNGTITIYHTHAEKWGVDPEQLLRDALQNTRERMPYQCYPMDELLREMLEENVREEFLHLPIPKEDAPGEEWTTQFIKGMVDQMMQEEKKCPMHVLTSQTKFLGAIYLLFPDILETIAEKLGGDLVILPSSVHEVILIPQEEVPQSKKMKTLVAEVNETQVQPYEILSDRIYNYSVKDKKIRLL